MSDQINSTRIITDDLGNVVYSEAYGPYGDFQKTWTKTYDPKQKFSGKEREGYSELDYFGARYFDNNSNRFIAVDPIINKEGAIGNPQLWNLYAYCANNPITHFDPDGRKVWLGARSLDHPLVGSLGVHTYILIMPNNPADFGGKTKWAISGYPDKKGRLNLDLNDKHDRDLKFSERKGLYEITPPNGKSDSAFIKDILNTTQKYKNLSRNFDKYPNITNNEGNCNSLSTSILVGAGVSIDEIKKIDPPGFNWGLGEVFPEMVNKK
ncbi:MAG: hypothetical protein QG657_4230 [Acidobacteriota bacterium]|nr:hypothetical protein [Acidobacteriota bacterium]